MPKSLFSLICAVMCGTIVILCGIAAEKYGLPFSVAEAVISGLIIAAIIPVAFNSSLREKIRRFCCDYDWLDEAVKSYRSIPALYRKSFWILFGFINLAFLFHTINFMWGNRDWEAIRFAVDSGSALKEGNFAAFWLQELLFGGKILPVINNLWAFAGLALAGVLLSVYWQLPKNAFSFVMTGLFFAVTPYTLGWLYFAQNTLGTLWLPAMILTALLLSERNTGNANGTYAQNLVAIFLLLTALGTFLPVVNFIGVALIGKVLLKTVFADISLRNAFKRERQSMVNLTATFLIYAFITVVIKETGLISPSATERLVSLSEIPYRIPVWLAATVLQFSISLPFIDQAYRTLYLLTALTALFTLILRSPDAKASLRGLALIPLLLTVSQLSFLLYHPSAEHPAFAVRTAFFGLPFIYALALALILKLGNTYLRRWGYVLAVLAIFAGFVRVAYALKVWKFGWDAETKLAERIITRLEKMPDFNLNGHYKLLQIGEQSLRNKYYLKKTEEKPSGELLSWAYYPAGGAKDAYNFYYQADFLASDADITAAAEENHAVREYILNRARPWPAAESLFISGEYIVLILDDAALAAAQKQLDK